MNGRVATLYRFSCQRRLTGFLVILLLLAWAAPAPAVTDLPVFGPKRYDRLKGAPTVYADTFERCEPSGLALLRVWNGESKESRITAAEIFVNGAETFAELEFKQHVDYLEKLIPVREVNEIKVVLKSGDPKIPSFLKIDILGRNCDGTPPVIADPQPVEGALLNVATLKVSASYTDEVKGSGIDPASARMQVDGRDVTALAEVSSGGIHHVLTEPLPEGEHAVFVAVSDRATNVAGLSWSFTTDTISPVAQITSHADGVWLNTPTTTLSGTLSERVLSVTANGNPAVVTEGGFILAGVILVEGANTFSVEAIDRAGNRGSASLTANLDTVTPAVTLTTPPQGLLTNNPRLDIAGMAEEPILAAMVNGAAAVLDGQGFTVTGYLLSEGDNLLTASVVDRAGNPGAASVRVTLDTIAPKPPTLDPPDSPTNAREATLSGSAEPLAMIRVFSRAPGFPSAELLGVTAADATGRFALGGVTLMEGSTVLTATATDAAANESGVSAPVAVTLDTVPPVITVDTPAEGHFTNALAVAVSGTLSEAATRLTVNGEAVVLSSRSFSRTDVPLAEGENTMVVVAFDLAGNNSTAAVTVHRDTLPPTVTIAAPADGMLTNVAQVDVAGSVDEPVTSVSLNGVAPLLSRQSFAFPAVVLAEGENTLTVSAVDRAGNVGSTGVAVRLDSIPPPAPLLDAPVSPTNGATLTLTGTAEAGATVTVFVTPPEGVRTLLATVSADGQGRFTLEEVALVEGETLFTATARDAAGNESAFSAVASVVLDTTPPVITVTSPADHAVSDALEIRVSGTLSEPASLTLDDAAVALNGSAFDHPVTLVPGVNTLILLAADLVGNSTVASLTIYADSTPPTVTLTSPPDGLLTRSATVTVAGSLSESATLTLNGAPLAANGLNFSTVHTLTEGENTLTGTAIDGAGNVGSASIRVVLDTTAPTLSLSAPAEGNAGQNLPLTVGAADGNGLALVEVRAGGVAIWSASPGGAASLSDAVTYTLSPTLASGASVGLTVRAVDAVGNATTAGARITVAQEANGPGYLVGEAYDDRRGLRLGGAAWHVRADGAAIASGVTADDGGYFLELPAGDYLVRLEKEGYTAVERTVTVRAEQTTTALDARLTPVSATAHPIGVPGGGVSLPLGPEAGAPALILSLPADALAREFDLRLTPVSNQGLAGLLPAGWSPLAAFELRALDVVSGEVVADPPVFSEASPLQVPLPQGVTLPEGSTPILAHYDEARHVWVAAASAAPDAQGGRAETALLRPGHYALLLFDPAPGGPPAVIPGEVLPGAAVAVPDYATVTAAGRVVPVASPAAAGITAVGEVVLIPKADPTQPLVSGLTVTGRVTERFDLASGETVQPAEYVQDLLLYRAPCVTNPGKGSAGEAAVEGSLRATFPVSPSRDYSLIELLLGKVGVEIRPGEAGESGGVMVGASGARLIDADGTVLEIPAGALARTTPVSTRATAGATALVGADFRLLRAVAVDLADETLSTSAILSIPAPEGFDDSLPVVLVLAVEVGGVQKLKLVGVGKPAGSMLVSSSGITPDLTGAGIVRSGTYCFLQAKAPLGYLRGTVSGTSGAPFAGALVTASTTSLADVTGSAGRYLLAAPLLSFEATALDLVRRDRGTGAGTLAAASQVLTLDLAIRATPPQVVSVTPADGATGVEPSAAIQVVFSEPVERASVTEQSLQLKDAVGNTIPGVFSFSPDGTAVTLYPAAALRSETRHTLTIAGSIRDLQGYPLAQGVTSAFTVRDTTPPLPPPAGSISATFPDEEGMITVTATQGSAEIGCTVLVINDTSGEIVAVTPQTNGSFTARIAGQLGDEIQIVLMDAAGNQTLVTYLTFKAPDGRYLVTAKGGKVEGAGGSRLEIPEGALVGPAVVKLTIVPETELPHAVPEITRFLGAVKVDTGGIGFQKEVKLSVPAPPNMPAEAVPFLTRPLTHVNPDGTEEELFEIVNSAKVIDDRLTTASPPFAGVLAPGIFAFLYSWPVGPVGGPVVVSGTTYRDMDGLGGYMPGVDQLIRGAVIRSPGAENFIAYSDANGHYASYGFTARDVCRNFAITAIHPQTMFRNTANITTCDAPYIVNNFNFKLADKGTTIPDSAAPAISIGLQVVPGQTGDPRLIAGTVPVGTNIAVPVSIIDQEVTSATLVVEFKTPDMGTAQIMPMVLNIDDKELHTPMQGETPALYRYHFRPQFSGAIASATAENFRPNRPGTYTLVVEAVDGAGNRASRRMQVRAVEQGEAPEGIDGPPEVDSILPADGAVDAMVTTQIVAWFSEPVENVNDTTFRLFEVESGREVPAYVYTGLEGERMMATLVPKGNLTYGRAYRATLGSAIKDMEVNPSAPPPYASPIGGGRLPLAETSVTFTTKVPRAFDLAADSFTGGRDIDLYTRPEDGRTFVYVTAGAAGWRVVEVTDPTHPAVVHSVSAPSAGWSFRGVAVEQESALLALTDHIAYADGNQYGYVRFHDLAADPTKPLRLGQEKLAEAYSGIPGRLDLAGNYAYIATAGAGVQVVDIELAKTHVAGGTPSDGSAIVGVFDSSAQGYGQPNDALLYAPGRLLVTSNGGYLLLLSTAYPAMPTLNSAWRPEGTGVTRAAAVGGYQYADADDNPAVIDLALAGLRDGRLVTLDVTDPYNIQELGTAVDEAGQIVNTWANDLSLSKEAGLAFITTLSSIQVFDIKDPTAPRQLITITQLPDENGNLLPLGSIPALVERGGWVYLGSEAQGMRVVDLDPHTLKIVPKPISLAGRVTAPAKADIALGVEIRPDTGFRAKSAYLRVYEDDRVLWETTQPVPMEVQTSVIFPAKSKGLTFDVSKRYSAGIRLVNVDGAVFEMEKKERVSLPLSWPVLFPDYNHDRKIDQADIDRAVKGDTYYYWINDDDDEGETEGDDIPKKRGLISSDRDCDNIKVDGVRDLIDFFPVVLDIKPLLDAFPPGLYEYRLKTAGENLNVVFSNLDQTTAGNYLTDVDTARRIAAFTTYPVPANGTFAGYGRTAPAEAQQQFNVLLQRALEQGTTGVILFESSATGKEPLALEVADQAGQQIFTASLNLSLDGVEQMFRHVNLIAAAGGPEAETSTTIGEHKAEGGEQTRPGPPANYPDSETEPKYFVMLHGANVNGQEARGWQSEMFKRLYWSGLKDRFVGVSWYGAEGADTNYHHNVIHAFQTAAVIGPRIKAITQDKPVSIMAHSLGNMVVSSYLADHYGATSQAERPVITNYYLFNAAVALEAYLGDYQGYAEGKLDDPNMPRVFDSDNPMVHSDWFGYDKRLGASEWHQLFAPDDPRRTLTWRERFKQLPTINMYSFFSSGEEVLATFAGDVPEAGDIFAGDFGRNSWVFQEKWKGRSSLNILGGTTLMGWGFNSAYSAVISSRDKAAANALENNRLTIEPFFRKPFSGDPGAGLFLNPVNLNFERNELLARGLPALTLPVGGHEGVDAGTYFDGVFNMNGMIGEWPRGERQWLHNDIRKVAITYNYQAFKRLIETKGEGL